MGQAYIIQGYRSAVGKAKKGGLRFYRPDDLAADVIKHLMDSVPQLDKNRIDDVIVGNAFPEFVRSLHEQRIVSHAEIVKTANDEHASRKSACLMDDAA